MTDVNASTEATQASILFVGAGLAPAAIAMAQARGVQLTTLAPHPAEAQLIKTIETIQPDVIIMRSGKLGAAAIHAAKRLKLITKHGVGVDSIDVATATACGIPVAFAAGANAQSVAEHAFALMFAASRNVVTLDHAARNGSWDKVPGRELTGKTLGLIGFGTISRRLAELVAPLRMPILVHDPYVSAENLPASCRIAPSIDALASGSDVVSLHCPLTPETANMFDARRFALMRDGAILINTARGGLIDETALVAALKDGKLSGAGLDTVASEPPGANSPLWAAPNLIVTPHVGADTAEARARVGVMVMEQALAAIEGHLPDQWMVANPIALKAA